MTDKLEPGKLPQDILERFLSYTSRERGVLIGAHAGEDAALVEGSEKLIITADPITFTEEDIAVYTVAVNCNDIVAMGGEPAYLTTTILLPPGVSVPVVERLFRGLKEASKIAGISWIGGHTEVTDSVNRVVVSGQVVGFLRGKATPSSGARPGEVIVMTKWAGLEGTTIIAREKRELVERLIDSERAEEIRDWIYRPGISILKEGRILREVEISAAHDPTEGGIATGIHEIATRSECGVILEEKSITVREETRLICNELGIDPLGLLSSGVFLFTSREDEAERAVKLLQRESIDASIIGRITGKRGEVLLERGSSRVPLPIFNRDEIIKVLE